MISASDKPFSLVKGESKVFADCRFWDFAGQKEFYATHQTFLNPNAVYLLVVDVSTDFTSKTPNDMLDKEFETSGGNKLFSYIKNKPCLMRCILFKFEKCLFLTAFNTKRLNCLNENTTFQIIQLKQN